MVLGGCVVMGGLALLVLERRLWLAKRRLPLALVAVQGRPMWLARLGQGRRLWLAKRRLWLTFVAVRVRPMWLPMLGQRR